MTRTNLNDAIARATRNGMTVRLIRGTARQLHLWPFLTNEEGEFMRIELQFTYHPTHRMVARHVPVQETSEMWEKVAAEITDATDKLAEYVGLDAQP